MTYIAVNFILILFALLGYKYSKRGPYFLAPASFVISLFIIFVCRVDVLPALLSVFLFNYLFLGLASYKGMLEDTKKEYEKTLGEKSALVRDHSSNLEGLYIVEDRITEKELAVVKLYEMTKKMSWALRLEDIVGTLGNILRENFTFKRCEIILFQDAYAGMAKDKFYAISLDCSSAQPKEELDYEHLIKFMGETPSTRYFTRKADGELFGGFNIKDGVKTLAVIPLVSENKPVGILTITDLPYISLDMAAIVSMQFTLEIKRVMLYEKIEELAITDGLTGLYVRRYFLERFEEELNRSKRYGLKFAFLMIDIDDFKKINDTHGHLVGDVILKEAGRIIKSTVREIDLVSRYGGEEFSVLLPETASDGAKLVAERIRSRMEESTFKAYDEKLKMTVSVGLSLYPDDSHSSRGILECADSALYVAKRSGKNLVCEYKK